MPSRSHRTSIVAAAVLVILALGVLLAACAFGDKYSGTWTGTDPAGGSFTLKIEKSGDKWLVSNPEDTGGYKMECTEKDGKLTGTGSGDMPLTVTFERKGDKLIESVEGIETELTKK